MNYYNYPKYLKAFLTSVENGTFDKFSDEYLREHFCRKISDAKYFDLAFYKRRLRIYSCRRLFYKCYLLLILGKEDAFKMVDLMTPPCYHKGYEDLLD